MRGKTSRSFRRLSGSPSASSGQALALPWLTERVEWEGEAPAEPQLCVPFSLQSSIRLEFMTTSPDPSTLRIGSVPYLNGKPLIHGLDRKESVSLETAVPSELSERLAAGAFDIALVPCTEYLFEPGRCYLDGICIASQGPVWSVRLFLRQPMKRVRKITLDSSSRASALLLRILMREKFGIDADFVSGTPTPDVLANGPSDAVLVIGDQAMTIDSKRWEYLDLGKEWTDFTGFPFVYALWTATSSKTLERARPILEEAKDSGQNRLEEIARSESRRLGLPAGLCVQYIRDIIRYDLGPDELKALELTRRLAKNIGIS